MSGPSAAGVYSWLLRLYPRRFRNEYGTDMALLFAQQLRGEPTSRVWARGVVDLAVTIPTQHLEAHMDRPPNPSVPVVFAAVSVSGLVLAAIGGSNLGMLGVGLAVAGVTGVLAIVAWRHTRGIPAARPVAERWRQVLLAGVIVLATTIVVVNVVGEVSDGWWLPMMVALLAGAITTAAGLILGALHLIENRPGRAPA